jgi:hypothetical protein
MLLTLVATSSNIPAPILPDLHVRDSYLKINVPVAGVPGWDNDFLQTQTITNAPLEFSSADVGLSSGSLSTEYWCRRLSKIILNMSFSDSGANATVRILRKDKNNIRCYGELRTVTALSHAVGSNYGSEIEVFESYGANKMRVLVESISSGTVDIRLAGV